MIDNELNYYEKFGAKYMETLTNGEKLFFIELWSINNDDSFLHWHLTQMLIIYTYSRVFKIQLRLK